MGPILRILLNFLRRHVAKIMKKTVLIMGLTFLNFQMAQAGWLGDVINNGAHALADVYSVGGYGRERQSEFEQKEAQLQALRHQEYIQRQEAEIKKLQELIKFANETKAGSEEVKSRNSALYVSLTEVNELFKQQLSGNVRIQSRAEGLKASAKEQEADFELLSVLLKHVAIPDRQRPVMELLQSVARDRGLQVQDYIARALEQTQLNRTNLIKINKLLSELLPQIKGLEQIQIDQINKIEETITINQNSLDALILKKNNQEAADAAAAAADQARIKNEQDEAAKNELKDRPFGGSATSEARHRRIAD